MRISDWSSDLCSSDLIIGREVGHRLQPVLGSPQRGLVGADSHYIELPALGRDISGQALAQDVLFEHHPVQLDARMFGLKGFRERDRKSVVLGKSVSVRVDLEVR